jgi:hypothetical protein
MAFLDSELSDSRRGFLKAAASGACALGSGSLSFLASLPTVSAEEARLSADTVRLEPDIEPLVRLLEETPRERLLEEVAARIAGGLAYREVLAALLLAGVRNVQPRPSVGFKFHAVLVVNSAHLASISSPDSDRWLPIFWALDYFKSAQAQDVKEGNWTMGPVDESRVPEPAKTRAAFVEAMERWDEEAADAAVAGLARSAGANDIFELFFRFGARDFRAIGHKAIFVANSLRTLECIGWQHAEPVLRSLAYALLQHEEGSPATRDAAPDRPWRRNLELARKIRPGWQGGRLDADATRDMLAALREGSADAACDKVVDILNRGISPRSLWDALMGGAGELLMRSPGIVSLHAVTSTNALHQAFLRAGSEETARLLLLQNAAFVPLFREAIKGRGGNLGEVCIDRLEREENAGKAPAIGEIFAAVGRESMAAARKTFAYLEEGGSARELLNAARVLIFLKGRDSHDYKFSSAVLEDYHHVSPAWRNRFLAASVFHLRGSGEEDNPLVQRTRAALGA